mmetsp:Transcript_50293/g.151409  ORF Transcript_50293/g.151409 Transcript_50293/m.151409 type:complete len:127 (+) Transcript_50293:1170-1550(+)
MWVRSHRSREEPDWLTKMTSCVPTLVLTYSTQDSERNIFNYIYLSNEASNAASAQNPLVECDIMVRYISKHTCMAQGTMEPLDLLYALMVFTSSIFLSHTSSSVLQGTRHKKEKVSNYWRLCFLFH